MDPIEQAQVFNDLYTGRKATGSLVCPDAAAIPNGQTLTIPDGTNTVVFEARAKARSLLSLVAFEDMEDGDTLVLDDGVNEPITFEAMKSALAVAASGSITCVAKANLKNNERIVIGDGTHSVGFRFNTAAAAAATGTIACVAKANLRNNEQIVISDGAQATIFRFHVTDVTAKAQGTITCVAKADFVDGETITISDGTNTAILEIDKTGDGVAQGNVQVDISNQTTAQSCAIKLASVINDILTGLTVEAVDVTSGVVTLEADTEDYTHNVAITHTVANAGFSVTGMSGGVSAFDGTGAQEVDVTGATTNAQVATILYTAINNVGAGLTVTATEPTDQNVALTADASDYTHNVAITHTVANGSFTVSGMSGGVTAFSAEGDTEVDVTAVTTDAQVASTLRTAINNVVAGLTVTAGAPDGAVLPLANDAVGIAGNVTITHTVADSGFDVDGMSGGVDGFTPTGGGIVVIDMSAASDDADAIQAVVDAVNDNNDLDLLAEADATGVVLTQTATGEYTLAASGAIFSDIDVVWEGIGGELVGGATILDLSGVVTAAQHATALAAAINAVGAGLTVTATPSGAGVSLENDTCTADGNVNIVQSGSGAYTSIVGMTGGFSAIVTDATKLSKLAEHVDEILALLET